MNIIVVTILSLIGYLTLTLISTNLIGMVVRGFFVQETDFEDFIKKGKSRPYTKKGVTMGERTDKQTTIIFSIITIVFLYLLYRFINIWAVMSATILILSRIPDLLWEIKAGKKVTMNEKPEGVIHTINGILMWLALPILWWSLYSVFVY